jgi:telomere length regulation protein
MYRYIRDLIAGLRDNENYDRHQLALSTSASLIRRKANFGSEVSDHIEELASILVGLNDPFELPNFPEMRQQALITVLIAQPAQMGQWFARAFFSGDYSLTQRVAMLTTMGLGARELAGFKDDELGGSTSTQEYSFPSKMLPPKLHKIYAAEVTPVNLLAKRLEDTMIGPIALNAADKLSGPNALKVRTFSSRMEVEKKRKKPIPNALAMIVAQNFFFPLTGRWWTHMQASDPDSLYTSPHLLPPYLQTLSILLHASGPSTLSLPQMTSEFWDLLLSVRGAALADPTILSALLLAFLTLLDINEDKQRLAQEQAKELLETQEWVRGVFERLGGGGEEDGKTRMLAAGVLVRCGEVVEKYQRMLVGDMMDF